MTAPTTATVTVTADTSQAVSQIGKVTAAVEKVTAALRGLGPTKGVKTSEFWVVILSTPAVLGLLSTVFHGDFGPHVQLAAVILAQVSSLVYAALRTHLKRPTSWAAAEFDLKALLGLVVEQAPAAETAVKAATAAKKPIVKVTKP